MNNQPNERKQTRLAQSIKNLLHCCQFTFKRYLSALKFYRKTKETENQQKKKILVLDLDETLVHSQFTKPLFYDFLIKLLVFDLTTLVYVNIRPYALQFIEEMQNCYDIVLFTASLRQYAEPVMDKVDPKRLSKLRLFREDCTYYKGFLSNLKDIVLIDVSENQIQSLGQNNRISFMFQPQNGIKILDYYDNKQDSELQDLIPFLKELACHNDVRPVQKKLQMYQIQRLTVFSLKNSEDIESAHLTSKKDLLNKEKYQKPKAIRLVQNIQGDLNTEIDHGGFQNS